MAYAGCQRRARLVEALALTRPEARLFADQAHAPGATAGAPNAASVPAAHWPKQCAVRVHAGGPAGEKGGRDAISLEREFQVVLARATAQMLDVSEVVVGVPNASEVPEHGRAHAKRHVVVNAALGVALGHVNRAIPKGRWHNHACLPVYIRPYARNSVELDGLLRLKGRDHGAALLHVAQLLQEGSAAVMLALAHITVQPRLCPVKLGGAPAWLL